MKKLLVIPALAILVGCGGGGGTNTPIDNDLLGSWSRDCDSTIFDESDGDNYMIKTIIFKKGGIATYKEIYYSDSSCADKTGNGTTTNGTYSAGEKTVAEDGEKAKKLDVHIADVDTSTMYRLEDNKKTLLQANWGDDGEGRENNFEDPIVWHKK